MSAASSWMMSGAVPPTKLVKSLSCTESQSPWTYCTWIVGWLLFQAFTIAWLAATVGFCQARLWNVSLTVACPDADAPWAAVTAHAAAARTAAARPIVLLFPFMPLAFLSGRGLQPPPYNPLWAPPSIRPLIHSSLPRIIHGSG